jgi:hypothetical protein
MGRNFQSEEGMSFVAMEFGRWVVKEWGWEVDRKSESTGPDLAWAMGP